MRLTQLADVARAAGLTVHECPGWQSRGGSMDSVSAIFLHHTAGAARGDYPSLGVVRDGRAGIPGPLAQIGLGRSGTVYVIAAGRANHAGRGSGHGLPRNGANPHALGIEAESTGYGDWTPEQIDTYPRLAGALARHYGVPIDRVIGHKEWTSRKIDPAGWPGDMPGFRAAAANPAPLTDWFDMATEADLRAIVREQLINIFRQPEFVRITPPSPESIAQAVVDIKLDPRVGTFGQAVRDSRIISRRAEMALDIPALAQSVAALLPAGAPSADDIAAAVVKRLES